MKQMINKKKNMKKSKPTKSNDPAKILKMISRDLELERNDGKWIAMNRPYKNKKKYDRKRDRKIDPDSLYFLTMK
jgi:hypothetical protein